MKNTKKLAKTKATLVKELEQCYQIKTLIYREGLN